MTEPSDASTPAPGSTSNAQPLSETPRVAKAPRRNFGLFGRLALAFLAGGLALALVLVALSYRRAWPFALVAPPHAHSSVATDSAADAGAPQSQRVAITVPSDRLEGLGVALTSVRRQPLTGELRTIATVVPDESRVSHVHTRVSGWIDRLAVRTTGESVRTGEVLGSIFSRELLASQTEYLASLRASGAGPASPIARGGHDRLGVLGMTEAEIASLERRGTPARNVPILAPRAGVVLHRGVSAGAAVDPSTELFVIADLTTVWVLAELPEARMADVSVGSLATIDVPAAGVVAIESTVAFVYPTLTEGTRTLRVRFVVENPAGVLRPGTYGSATFHLTPRSALVVPRDAIVDSGAEQHVFVAGADDRFEPRTVRLGTRLGDLVEVLEGVSEGERVVASGVFLLDSESRLRASGGGTAHQHGATTGPTDPAHAAPPATDTGNMDGMPGMGQGP